MFRAFVWVRRLVRELWFRVSLFAALAILVVLLAHVAAPLVPDWLNDWIDAGALIPVLTIIASSMLAVSTFSLGIMVSSHRAAAQTATPRVMELMTGDGLTHVVLGVFIGAFVYALTALILFQSGFNRGAPLVMVATLAVTGAVVLALVRWIAHLTTLGTMGDALSRAEAAARRALYTHRSAPALGALSMGPDTVIPDDARTLTAPGSGILQLIDVNGLARCAHQGIWVLRRPGQVVLKGAPLVQVAGQGDDAALLDCFVVGHHRTFEQDPGFALTVLSEIASRALSPAVNDPGTAIEVISRLERLLWDWAHQEPAPGAQQTRVFVAPWTAPDLIEAAFAPIARDGATMLEVVSQLLDALTSLANGPDSALADAARSLSHRAHSHAAAALRLQTDVARLPPELPPSL